MDPLPDLLYFSCGKEDRKIGPKVYLGARNAQIA